MYLSLRNCFLGQNAEFFVQNIFGFNRKVFHAIKVLMVEICKFFKLFTFVGKLFFGQNARQNMQFSGQNIMDFSTKILHCCSKITLSWLNIQVFMLSGQVLLDKNMVVFKNKANFFFTPGQCIEHTFLWLEIVFKK